MKKLNVLVAVGLLSLTSAVHAGETLQSLKALKNAAKMLAKADLSCDADADCVVVPLGARACGGPSEFTITSKSNANLDDVMALAKSSKEKQKRYNRENRIRSSCVIARAPEVACDDGRCVDTTDRE